MLSWLTRVLKHRNDTADEAEYRRGYSDACTMVLLDRLTMRTVRHKLSGNEASEKYAHGALAAMERLQHLSTMSIIHSDQHSKFKFGDRVTKTIGSSWTGKVCGFYHTTLTPEGYCVESENEPGSVQIYPAAALQAKPKKGE